uniref:DNA mismatch repair protein Mlh3-like isoform X1 n=1 Tax=Myxine glutinosa TaxID=7769 RepID=UPI00358EA5CE
MISELPLAVQTRLRSDVAVASAAQCLEDLVLNSLDAGASCVAIRSALLVFRLQVVDNGVGISRADLEKLGQRYFTSKCHRLSDLERLRFYGYRGEALASISSLASAVEITTRAESSTKTFTKIMRGEYPSHVFEAETVRPSVGTTVAIHNLFYNLPVRRKCTPPVLEYDKMRKKIEAIALIHHGVSFSLQNDDTGTTSIQLKRCNGVAARFGQLFGYGKSRKLSEVRYRCGEFKVIGHISKDSHHNKSLQFIYVNKRLVLKTKLHCLVNILLKKLSVICKQKSSPRLTPKAAQLSPSQRDRNTSELYGIFILNISCPLSDYDICLDPKKTLIEFKHWENALSSVENAIKEFLQREGLSAKVDIWREDIKRELISDFRVAVPIRWNTANVENQKDKPEEHSRSADDDSYNISWPVLQSKIVMRKPQQLSTEVPSAEKEEFGELPVENCESSMEDKTTNDLIPLSSYETQMSADSQVLHKENSSKLDIREDSSPDAQAPTCLREHQSSQEGNLKIMKNIQHRQQQNDDYGCVQHVLMPMDSILFERDNLDGSSAFAEKTDKMVDSTGRSYEELAPPRDFILSNLFEQHDKSSQTSISCHDSRGNTDSNRFKPPGPTCARDIFKSEQCEKIASLDSKMVSNCRRNRIGVMGLCLGSNGTTQGKSSGSFGDILKEQESNDVDAREATQAERYIIPRERRGCFKEALQKVHPDYFDKYMLGHPSVFSRPIRKHRVNISRVSSSLDRFRWCLSKEDSYARGTFTDTCCKSKVQSHALLLNKTARGGLNTNVFREPSAMESDNSNVLIADSNAACSNQSRKQISLYKFYNPDRYATGMGERKDNLKSNEEVTCEKGNFIDFPAVGPTRELMGLERKAVCCNESGKRIISLSRKLANLKNVSDVLQWGNKASEAEGLNDVVPRDFSPATDCRESKVDDATLSRDIVTESNFCTDSGDAPLCYPDSSATNNDTMSVYTLHSDILNHDDIQPQNNSQVSEGRPLSPHTSGGSPGQRKVMENLGTITDIEPGIKLHTQDDKSEHGPGGGNPSESKTEEASDNCTEIAEHHPDWVSHFDTALEKMVYVNLRSGHSSYEPPQIDQQKVLCCQDFDTMSVSVVGNKGFVYDCKPFLGSNGFPFLPRLNEESIEASGSPSHEIMQSWQKYVEEIDGQVSSKWKDGIHDRSTKALLGEWENPVFSRPADLAVDTRRCQSGSLAVKVHKVLYHYKFTKDMISSFEVIRQVDKKFIACLVPAIREEHRKADGKLLVLVDQHAAHERVRLEQLTSDLYKVTDNPSDVEARVLRSSCVIPALKLQCDHDEVVLLRTYEQQLQRHGLELAFTQDGCVEVSRVPSCFVEQKASEARHGRPTEVKSMIEELIKEEIELLQETNGAVGTLPRSIIRSLNSQACHGAVKFGDKLTRKQCTVLLRSLAACKLPFQCAHGRPSMTPLADLGHLKGLQGLERPDKPNLGRLRQARNRSQEAA